MRKVRVTALDHRLGRRVTVAQFNRVGSARDAATLVRAVLRSGGLRMVELPQAESYTNDGWQPFNYKENA